MTEEQTPKTNNKSAEEEKSEASTEITIQPGVVSKWLSKQDLKHTVLEPDHIGTEIIGIESLRLLETAKALKEFGFNYLQCQGGYDEGPGLHLVCFYHLIAMNDLINNDYLNKKVSNLREVRLKVFLSRDGDLCVPSLYRLFHGSDWQERETYDMFGIKFNGHPHPKRLLMPEDWEGWPLRKDYIQPDFYEMQDAY